jgi:hypothetical protein
MLSAYGFRVLITWDRVFGLSMQLREREPRPGTTPRPVAPKVEEMPGGAATMEVAKKIIDELRLESSSLQWNTINRENAREDEYARLHLGQELEQLSTRIREDLSKRYFVFIEPGNESFWGNKDAFNLGKKFKDAHADIEAAGNCFAYQQPTACIFHLMRAMEVAVRQLARRPQMQITITPQTTWRQITGAMDPKIRAMPETTAKQKEKKNNWEEARANLHHVGSVWRNNTMHPAKSYTPSQARDVYNAVRVFMGGLSAL